MAAASGQPQEGECAVCTNDFTIPKILPCGHLLCRECVMSWVNLRSDAGCPLCRCPLAQPQGQSVRSPSDIADALPTDFAMEALVDSAAVLNKNGVCCACDDVKAEHFCMQCRDLLCPSCCRIHQKIPATRSHDVEILSSVTPERLAASRPALCADHGEKQSLFCPDHSVPVCTACAIAQHRLCPNIKDIDSEIDSAKESLKNLMVILLMAERELEQSIAEVDTRLQKVNVREQKDIAEIDKVRTRLQKLVEDFCEEMKKVSGNSHSEVKKSLHDIKSSLGQRLGIVASHKRILSRTTTIAPRHTLMQAAKALQDRVNSLDLSADLEAQVWGDPPSYGTRCHDVIRRIEKELQQAAKQTTNLEETNPSEAQTFWQQWTEAAFPDLDSRVYFLPPVHVNHVTTGLSSAGQPPPVYDSDVRHDVGLQRVLCSLQKLFEEKGEVLVGMSQLQFGQHLGQPCYGAAAVCLLESSNLRPALPWRLSSGDFDVLLIHRQYGLVALEIKRFGDSLEKPHMSQLDLDNNIRRKIKEAVLQLAKTKAILSHLVSDIAQGLRITKTISFPNLTTRQVQQAISGDPQLTQVNHTIRHRHSVAGEQRCRGDFSHSSWIFRGGTGDCYHGQLSPLHYVALLLFRDFFFQQDLCRCFGTTDPADIPGLCVCSDQLSDPKTPWEVTSDVLRELGNWWQRRVAGSGLDNHMTCDNYKTLVARLCGPATTVAVPCTSPPRLCVKNLGQAVSLTGECYTAQITLFPEQVHLLSTGHRRVFVAGPPGTGKTVVLLLMATEWLRCGNNVFIVSTWVRSLAACSMLYHLLLQIVNTQLTSVASSGRPHLLQYDFKWEHDVEKAVKDLSQVASGGSLYVIADNSFLLSAFLTFCHELLTQVPRLQLWAASYFHENAPVGWHKEYFTRPLRSPPDVVREVQQSKTITEIHDVLAYSERGVADHTDGPPVRRLYHRGQGHSGDRPGGCVTCGCDVASFLHSLRVPANVATTSGTVNTTDGGITSPCLQWRDVMVLVWCDDDSDQTGVVTGLREAGIPVRVMEDDDTEDVATARSDVVWVAHGARVHGLERKVVVCLKTDGDLNLVRLFLMSRCTSQLVTVSR